MRRLGGGAGCAASRDAGHLRLALRSDRGRSGVLLDGSSDTLHGVEDRPDTVLDVSEDGPLRGVVRSHLADEVVTLLGQLLGLHAGVDEVATDPCIGPVNVLLRAVDGALAVLLHKLDVVVALSFEVRLDVVVADQVAAEVRVAPAAVESVVAVPVLVLDEGKVLVTAGLEVGLDVVVLDEPITHVAVLPGAEHVVRRAIVVVLRQAEVLVTRLLTRGLDDAVVDKPVVEIRVAESLVRCVDSLAVGRLDAGDQVITLGLGWRLYDTLLLQPGAKVVVRPRREDPVGGIVDGVADRLGASRKGA